MYWLISLVMSGVMFSAESNLPINTNYGVTESNITTVVRLDETERFEQTYPLNANGRVSVSNVNGSITIETWDRNEVKLEAVKIADNKERLSEVEIKINARQDSFSVETDYDKTRRDSRGWRNNGKLQVEFKLIVPRNAVLDEIETVNGSINISNASNTTKASAVNGEVRATNLRGTANLSTVNGTVEADFDQLQTGSRISLNTVNGTVNLMIPSDANATIKADTVNGSINNDFGLPVRKGKYVGKDLYGKIGSGDVQIKLNSVNGCLSVKRKNDGKNVNPATNLLNLKNEEDSDDDDADEDNSNVRAPRPPKPPKPPKPPVISETDSESMRQAAEDAVRQAEKEIENISPEIEKITAEGLKQAAEEIKRINSEEFKKTLKEAQETQKAVLAQMREANWLIGSPKIEKKSDSFTVKSIPKVTVEAKNCAVSVRGWDKSEVQYTITRISKSRSQTPMNVQATQTGADVNIKIADSDKTPHRDFFNELNRVRLEVFVPKKSNLKITTNDEIRLEGVSGEIELNGEEGAINVRDADGKLTIASVDGLVRVLGFKGELDTKAVDGTISLEGDFQKLSAQTVDGNIILTLPENANANIESNRQDIKSEGISLVSIGDGKSISLWKIGKGGANHRLYSTADGQIFVRNANAVKTN